LLFSLQPFSHQGCKILKLKRHMGLVFAGTTKSPFLIYQRIEGCKEIYQAL